MNYPKKTGFNLYRSRHCAYITYRVKISLYVSFKYSEKYCIRLSTFELTIWFLNRWNVYEKWKSNQGTTKCLGGGIIQYHSMSISHYYFENDSKNSKKKWQIYILSYSHIRYTPPRLKNAPAWNIKFLRGVKIVLRNELKPQKIKKL